MKRDIDHLLKNALRPADEPEEWLNQRILNQEKEIWMMRKQHRRIPAAALMTAIVLALGSVTAVAAWNYLSPVQMAEQTEDKKLMEAFQSKDAIEINESQTYGGYRITLLGVVSGDGISDYLPEVDGSLESDRTYTAVAIEYADKTPMPDTSDPAYGGASFLVSPYIKGYVPYFYNSFTLSGGYTDFVQDGVLYRLSECNNVELFADKGVYLGVSDGSFYNQDAYVYDTETGTLTRNEAYEGVNALFDLPIPISKADPAAAKALIRSLEEGEAEEPETAEATAAGRWTDELTPENITERAVRLEETVRILTPDENGMLAYEYATEDLGEGNGTISMELLFPDNRPGMSDVFGSSASGDEISDLAVETFVLNEDGTVTFAVYVPK
ncbi:MAG: DUF4179 domain-containing protein [Lachnospiraceae bacterium]|nr:DUF4179 domain-containing protein [Lachnospiraceae bacterium]